MINRKYMELIHREIDNCLTPEESRQLREYLANNEEARRIRDSMVETSALLGQLQKTEPPESLKAEIMQSILTRKNQGRKKESLFDFVKTTFTDRITPGISYAFLAGVACTIVVMLGLRVWRDSAQLDSSEVSGTIISHKGQEEVKLSEANKFSVGKVSGAVEIRPSAGFIIAEIEVASPDEIELELGFDPDSLEFAGFSERTQSFTRLEINENNVRFSNKGGNSYTIVFEYKNQSYCGLVFRIFAPELVFEKSLKITGGPK